MVETRWFEWSWDGAGIRLGLDALGAGPEVLLLPAPSSISARGEMRPLMTQLASSFRVLATDWPGFGEHGRPALRWTPDALSAFLSDLLDRVVPDARLVVAAGHAASYLLHHAARHPGRLQRAALIAPTWRGPLPTMLGGPRPWLGRIRRAVERPLLGPLLYRLNVNRLVVRAMVGGHVYTDPRALSPQQRARHRRVIEAPGARFGSAAFVTGGLDRIGSRDEFLDLARAAALPLALVYGAPTPPKSRAEMEALGRLPGVTAHVLPEGKLGLHEEFPGPVAQAIRPFLLGD